MALVAKSNRIMALTNSQQGQISIFFSASLVVFISIIAFVINVGLFVKAKINLQNATDASAFAGAAVQSRQLTKIAYLNWEMRNIFKEWMYKYYVVGSLNTPMVENTANPLDCGGKNCMDFRLAPDNDALSGRVNADPYNFPAVCIHIAGSKTNICKRYAVPGLPEFGGYNIPGTEEASRSFIDILIGEKINDCKDRSNINMMVATLWAYNVLPTSAATDTLAGKGPAILSDRQGAWPRAIELAMRIRNLEKVMNREAIDKAVCIGGIGNCTPIDTYSTENLLGNERIVKAFYSGFRNLGNESDNEMKNSFTLQEIPPTKPATPGVNSNSSLLIPPNQAYEKQFVDLQLMMINYATFYAALIQRSELDKSGACDISKIALPVPGYPLGFYKNPDVLTYYAVKGEADFEGMFNPFSADTIKLTAFSAAKPAGGRIGPMLFKQKSTETALRPRSDQGKFRSVPYILSLKVDNVLNPFTTSGKVMEGEYGPGVPLPLNVGNNPFWLKDADDPIGGAPQGEPVQFGIPNLVYDFIDGDMNADAYTDNGEQLFVIEPGGAAPEKAIGLFNHDQFVAFKGAIGGSVTPEMLVDEISRVRAATQYEAANYLIPTPSDINQFNNVDSFGLIGTAPTPVETIEGLFRYQVDIYAPLYQEGSNQKDILYETNSVVVQTIADLMRQQKAGMLNYIGALNIAAVEAYKTSLSGSAAAVGAQPLFEKSAKGISDIDVVALSAPGITPQQIIDTFPNSCAGLASTFWHFYFGAPVFNFPDKAFTDLSDCPSTDSTLLSLLQKYYDSSAADPSYSSTHYKMTYSYNKNYWDGKPNHRIYSAYVPGPFNGIGLDGILVAPSGFPQNQENMHRNFYSTKFVTINSLRKGEFGYDEEKTNLGIYSEGERTSGQATPDRRGTFTNPLDVQAFEPGISSIKY